MSTQLTTQTTGSTTSTIGLNATDLEPTVQALNVLLSDFHVHYQNLRNFHWNVYGENFFTLHEQFETMYTDMLDKIDKTAERILSLGFQPLSTLAQFLNNSNLNEPTSYPPPKEMVRFLLDDYQILAPNMRDLIQTAQGVGDEGTSDMVTDFLKDLEKNTWMLNAFLEPTPTT
jgi:starvation-inducible DNA-binding protein